MFAEAGVVVLGDPIFDLDILGVDDAGDTT